MYTCVNSATSLITGIRKDRRDVPYNIIYFGILSTFFFEKYYKDFFRTLKVTLVDSLNPTTCTAPPNFNQWTRFCLLCACQIVMEKKH